LLRVQRRIVQVGAGRLAEYGHSLVTPHTSVMLLGLGDALGRGGRTWKQERRAEEPAPGIVLSDDFLEKDLRKCHQVASGAGSFRGSRPHGSEEKALIVSTPSALDRVVRRPGRPVFRACSMGFPAFSRLGMQFESHLGHAYPLVRGILL
jgi:hypothetical protein